MFWRHFLSVEQGHGVSTLQQTHVLHVITENHAAVGSDAWVDLLALETYFQALHLENDAFGFA